MRVIGIVVLAWLAVVAVTDPAAGRAGPTRWVATDLGTLGGAGAVPVAINDQGQIVGDAPTANGHSHAFLWQRGRMADLGTLGGRFTESAPVAINEHGEVIGNSTTVFGGAGGRTHAFLWQRGRMVDLGTLGGRGAGAAAINDRGQIVGYAGTGSGHFHAFLWQRGRMVDLGTLGGQGSSATAISPRGDVLGGSDTDQTDPTTGSPIEHTFLWSQGKMRDLGAGQFVFGPGGKPLHVCGGQACRGWAEAFNRHGQAAGYCIVWSKRFGDQIARPCLWQPDGAVRDLGVLQRGDRGRALALNDKTQIVGRTGIGPPSGKSHAFVWQSGRITDLGGLRPTDWSEADAINNQGQIVGISREDRLSPTRAVLWTSVVGPEPRVG